MTTPHEESTEPWTHRDLDALYNRLRQSKRMLSAWAHSLPGPCLLRWNSEPGAGEVQASFLPAVLTVGRKGDPPFSFPTDRSLSQQHFRIFVAPGGTCYAEDLASTNGLWINGRQFTSRRLVHGDQIHAGNQDFVFHDGRDAF